MGRVVKIQTNFSSGELDPQLRGRIDLEQYYNALETATNVHILPQGGAKRRDGLKFISELPSAAAPQNGVRLIPFEFNIDDSYMFAVTTGRIYIFKDQTLITNINGTGNDYLAVTAITAAMLPRLRHAQSADTIIFVHQTLATIKLVRGANDATWTLSTITFKNPPQHAFAISTSNPAGTVTPSGTAGNITLTASSSVFASGNVGQYINDIDKFGRARVVQFVSATVLKAVVEVNFFDTSAIANGDWEIEAGHEAAWSGTKGYPGAITFHEGRLWLAGTTSLPTTLWGSVANSFFDFELGEGLDDQSVSATITVGESLNAIIDMHSGRDLQIFTTGAEFFVPQATDEPITPANFIVRTATRNGIKPGVPVSALDGGAIYIQRLGKQLNEMVFTDVELAYTTNGISLLSSHVLKAPVDMAIRRATSTEEADRLYIVNSTGGSMAVYSLLRSQKVIAPSVFTTDGEFLAIGVDIDTIYTIVKRDLPLNATATVRVTDFANIETGATFTISTDAGVSETFTCQGSGTGTPDAFKFFKNASNDATADNIFTAINASSSNFTAANPPANTVTITRVTPGAGNLTVATSDSTRLTVTNFTGGSTAKYYVEVFDSTLNTDSSVYSASSSSTGAAAHLEKYLLNVIVDGNVQSDKRVASGSVSFDRASTSNYEIGLPYSINLKTMPVEPGLKGGNLKGFKKRILEVNAEVYNTQSMTINGQLVPFRELGSSVLDQSVTPFTGVKKIGPLLGFSDEGAITVSQSAPLAMQLLSLDYKLSVGT